MPPLVFDRSVPVTAYEDIRDVEAMMNQVEAYLRGNVDPAYACAAEAFTTREIINGALTNDKISDLAARRYAVNRTGKQVRRQVYHEFGVSCPGSVDTTLATHSYTSESANDCIFFIAKASTVQTPSITNLHISVDGHLTEHSGSYGLTQVSAGLIHGGQFNVSMWAAATHECSQVHLLPFQAAGVLREVKLQVNPSATILFKEIALYSWMMEVG